MDVDNDDDVVALIAKLNSIAPLVAAAARANYESMLASTAASSADIDLTVKTELVQTSAASSADKVDLAQSASFQ